MAQIISTILFFFSYAQVVFFKPLPGQAGGTVNPKDGRKVSFSVHETFLSLALLPGGLHFLKYQHFSA